MLIFLIGLVILGSVTSQSLMDVATFFLVPFFVYDLYKKKSNLKDIFPIGIEWAFAAYFSVAVISLAVNGKPPVPWFEYLSKFNWVLNLYLFIYAFNKIKFEPQKWLIYFSIAFLIPNIYSICTYIKQYDFIQNRKVDAVIGFVNSATYHAHGSSLIFVFFAALFLYNFFKIPAWSKMSTSIALVLMGLSTFLTFTRGIWGATFVSLCLLTLLYNRKLFLSFVSTVATVGLILFSTSTTIHNRLINSFRSESDHLRSELIQVHLEMFKEHPFFGIGYWDSYRQIADYWPRLGLSPNHFESHAHNQLVNVLATTGLLGFCFFICMIAFFTKRAWDFYCNTNKKSDLHSLAAACLVLIAQFALACLTDVTFEYAKIRGILIVGLAALISFSNKHKSVSVS